MLILSEFTKRYVPAVAVFDQEVERTIREAAKSVAPLFEVNDWKWNRPGGLVVPDEDMIADELRRLVRDLYRTKSERIATGRLVVDRVEVDDDAILSIHLELGEVCESVEELS